MWRAKGRTEKNAGLTYTRDADEQNKCGSVAARPSWVWQNVNGITEAALARTGLNNTSLWSKALRKDTESESINMWAMNK